MKGVCVGGERGLVGDFWVVVGALHGIPGRRWAAGIYILQLDGRKKEATRVR